MEIVIIIALIWIVTGAIMGITNKRKQNIRDQLAHEVLDSKFNYLNEKKEILSIREYLLSVKEKISFLTPSINLETKSDYTNFPVYTKTRARIFCPTCKNGKLVKRRGKYGIFWGCSNYPSCKFTQKRK